MGLVCKDHHIGHCFHFMITLLLNPHHISMSWGWSGVITRGSWDISVAMVMMTQSSVFSTSMIMITANMRTRPKGDCDRTLIGEA